MSPRYTQDVIIGRNAQNYDIFAEMIKIGKSWLISSSISKRKGERGRKKKREKEGKERKKREQARKSSEDAQAAGFARFEQVWAR